MRKLLNTLYVNTDGYLCYQNGSVLIKKGSEVLLRFPLLNLESIYTFGYCSISAELMYQCSEAGVDIVFFSKFGKFETRVSSKVRGNVYLRYNQFQAFSQNEVKFQYAKNVILAKVTNSKYILDRFSRDHPYTPGREEIIKASKELKETILSILSVDKMDSLRGLEGKAAARYFSVFDHLILNSNSSFEFKNRSKRPPLNYTNALLSFSYSLLTSDIVSALEAVGLDPNIGMNHVLRPGRPSLALDLLEELRAVFCDRFVLKLINKKMISESDFIQQPGSACMLTDDGRKKFLKYWQERKLEQITHPFLKEKICWGLVPYVQAKLLASAIRGDLDQYPPYFHG